MSSTDLPTCYKHPDRPAGVICQRCDRPICPECMHQASVGFHCPECAKGGAQRVYQGPQAVGGSASVLATKVLIGMNVAVFLVGLVWLGAGDSFGHVLWGGSLRMLIDGGLISKFSDGVRLQGVAEGQWWRMITSGFLHIGIIHIAFNMYALWWLGGEIERAFGWRRMLTIYGVSLLAGSFVALLIQPHTLSAGASGAIYGLMGAVVAVYRSRGIRVQDSPIFGVLIINFLFTAFASPYISVGGHIGGFLGGLVAGYALFDLPVQKRVAPAVPWLVCAAVAAVSLGGGILAASR